MELLQFQHGNAKIPKPLIFSILSGVNCPFAHLCHSRAFPDAPAGEKVRYFAVEQGLDGAFGCYSAGEEAQYPKVYGIRKRNSDLLKQAASLGHDQFTRTTMMVELLDESIKAADPRCKHEKVRVHVGGDFYSYEYMWAWLRVAERHPNRKFYAYTKSLPFWLQHHIESHIPDNFTLVASSGGRADHYIDEYPDIFKVVSHVVLDPNDPEQHKYPAEHGEDEMCFQESGHFDLILHGRQPQGPLSKQAKKNHDENWGYSKKNLKSRRQKVKQTVTA